LVADIHFQPKVAMLVADAFEKIRINPGKAHIHQREREREEAEREKKGGGGQRRYLSLGRPID
jgi:4-hydroxy-3-methylbut-2-en-1-yl diphosphate synthase IspG/GcpE